jgi:MFS family permease
MTEATSLTAAQEWRRNWTVVLAGMLGGALASVHIYSFGVMVEPLEKAFGWSRSYISSGMMVVSIVGVLLATLVGASIDRFGPRRIAMLAGTLYLGSVALLATNNGNAVYWYALWTLLGIFYAFISLSLWTAGVSSLFTVGRGLAQAVTLCGTAISSMLAPRTTVYFLEHFGWRSAYLCNVALWGGIILPLIFLFFTSARDRNRTAPATKAKVDTSVLPGLTAREGFRSGAFFKLMLGASAMSLGTSTLFLTMVPILTSKGLTLESAAWIAGLMGVGSVTGRVISGAMLDRLDAKTVAALANALPIPAELILIYGGNSTILSLIACLMLGLAMGAAVNCYAYLSSRHFGMRAFGTLFGTITGALVLFHGIAPVIGNHMYDVTKSYVPALWMAIPCAAVTSLCMALLGRYPDFSPSTSQPKMLAEAA